jgi:hypothetical protein
MASQAGLGFIQELEPFFKTYTDPYDIFKYEDLLWNCLDTLMVMSAYLRGLTLEVRSLTSTL